MFSEVRDAWLIAEIRETVLPMPWNPFVVVFAVSRNYKVCRFWEVGVHYSFSDT